MIRVLILAVGAVTAATGNVLRAGDPTPQAVDSIFAAYNHTTTPGCALGVYRDDKIVYSRGYGMADLNQGIPISPRTVFYVASTSKQFTAMSIALLAEQGTISLDDPVRKWIPELAPYADKVTIRHLVHHQSGIRDYLGLWATSGRSGADEIPQEVALDLIRRQLALDFAPGSRFSYSNSGYLLLSEIVKRASGKSLRGYAQAGMFGPLEMSDTHFHDDNTMIVPHRAEGYQPNGRGGFTIVRTSFALVGDGGLNTTVEDLLRWDANFFHNRLGRGGQALIDQVTTAKPLDTGTPGTYAFGLFPSTYRGLPIISHGGSFIGFRAELLRFPQQHFSVAVLCNDYTAGPEQLALRVADRYLADQLAPLPASVAGPAGVAVPAERLRQLTGLYEVLPGLVVTVKVDGSDLMISGFGAPAKLTALSDSTFIVPTVGEITFVTTPSGPAIVLMAAGNDPAPRLPDLHPLSAKDLAGYRGRFVSDELDTWATLETKGDTLMLRVRWAAPRALMPVAPDIFSMPRMGRFRFDRGDKGEVTGFRVSAGRMQNVIFARTGGV